jgi:hypothetical protein
MSLYVLENVENEFILLTHFRNCRKLLGFFNCIFKFFMQLQLWTRLRQRLRLRVLVLSSRRM